MPGETPTSPPEKRQRAVALRYDQQRDAAPRVVAKGDRRMAEPIIALAQEHGVPIEEDPDLVAALAQLELNTEIPEELYRAVAEVLAFVYRVGKQFEREKGGGQGS
jgi:flagellar biosynthesis protein